MSPQHPLDGRRIALLETREAERLTAMLEEQGAEVVGCPTTIIVDLPDPTPVLAWLDRLIAEPPAELILLTGEGLTRLHALAKSRGMDADFLKAVAGSRRITRGPKPARALRNLGIDPQLRAETPTTEGIVTLLDRLDLQGHRVGVQLYPGASERLPAFLREAGAVPDVVTPYEYAPNASDAALAGLIEHLIAGRIDAIAFTSAAQVRRLFDVARGRGLEAELVAALRATTIAAVGPIVAGEIEHYGLTAAVVPRDAYFMKPLVTAICAVLGRPA
ncbi:MAG: uroporphyrinogen-III synthase [Alphaproteobacteria bacterium]|nr:uroporphyrinogen-III synthase [Alphaproteobacteria bacterium]